MCGSGGEGRCGVWGWGVGVWQWGWGVGVGVGVGSRGVGGWVVVR